MKLILMFLYSKEFTERCILQTWIDSNFKLFDAQSFGTGQIDVEFAVFFSHYNLWMKCLELNESILILEHDVNHM